MNKKIIIISAIVGVAIIGGVYLYNKNKKANESNDTGMTTEKDALEYDDKVQKRKSKSLPADKMTKFVEQYTKNIDKKTHKGLMALLDKKSTDYTSQDKLYESTLAEKVYHPIGLK